MTSARGEASGHVSPVAEANAGVSTFVGASFVLIGGAWGWALLGAAVAGALYYAALVWATWQTQRSLLEAVRSERAAKQRPEGGRGRRFVLVVRQPSISTAVRLFFLSDLAFQDYSEFNNNFSSVPDAQYEQVWNAIVLRRDARLARVFG